MSHHYQSECLITSGVPVDVCDVAAGSFTDAHSLTGQDVVDVHKGIMGCNSQVFPRV